MEAALSAFQDVDPRRLRRRAVRLPVPHGGGARHRQPPLRRPDDLPGHDDHSAHPGEHGAAARPKAGWTTCSASTASTRASTSPSATRTPKRRARRCAPTCPTAANGCAAVAAPTRRSGRWTAFSCQTTDERGRCSVAPEACRHRCRPGLGTALSQPGRPARRGRTGLGRRPQPAAPAGAATARRLPTQHHAWTTSSKTAACRRCCC